MIAQNTFCSKWKQSPSCKTGKFIKYNPVTGHRIKDDGTGAPITWVHSLLKRNGALVQGWELSQCLFGEHLLAKYPDKPVALVESEKTAVVCACTNPDCVWLATGGKGQLNDRVIIIEHAEFNGLTQIGALVGKSGKIQKDNGE